jgi:hypothetical protein
MALRVLQVGSHRNFASAIAAHGKRFGQREFKSSEVGQRRVIVKTSLKSPEVLFWEVKTHGNLGTLSQACSRRSWPSTPRASTWLIRSQSEWIASSGTSSRCSNREEHADSTLSCLTPERITPPFVPTRATTPFCGSLTTRKVELPNSRGAQSIGLCEAAAPADSASKSIDIEIMSGCNLALIELANFFQHLLFATRFTALLCPRLVATWVRAVV